ncbi:MAG TPA: hypothetical protein VGS06_45155 [Streptosporangiaceae bacterium]|nr:hypothetical protein [Streptosporangiaceae bacterium]
MAAPPSTASPVSWNPAVPPPPVAGPPLGTEWLPGELLEPDAGVLLEPDAGLLLEPDAGLLLEPDAGVLLEPDAGALLEEPVCGLEVPLAPDEAPPLAAPLALELPDPLTVGDSTVTGGVLLEVQAESATHASMVVRPQPATVSRTRCDVHAMAVRALIEPPRDPGNDHFPGCRR